MVVADYLIKWTDSYPLPNQEAGTVAQKLVDEFICRFGVPERIHTDQGRSFDSTLFKEMCSLLEVEKTRTTPYHPHGDGMVERFNRSLVAMSSKYVDLNQRTRLPIYRWLWWRTVPVHMSHPSSLRSLIFGRDVRLPADLMFGRALEWADDYQEYVSELRESLENAH